MGEMKQIDIELANLKKRVNILEQDNVIMKMELECQRGFKDGIMVFIRAISEHLGIREEAHREKD